MRQRWLFLAPWEVGSAGLRGTGVVQIEFPEMGADDFFEFGVPEQQPSIPSLMFWLGAATQAGPFYLPPPLSTDSGQTRQGPRPTLDTANHFPQRNVRWGGHTLCGANAAATGRMSEIRVWSEGVRGAGLTRNSCPPPPFQPSFPLKMYVLVRAVKMAMSVWWWCAPGGVSPQKLAWHTVRLWSPLTP